MTPERWTFGETPLDEQLALAGALRDLVGMVLSLEGSSPELRRLVDLVAEARRDLSGQVPADLAPRVGPGPDPSRRVYLDHSRDIGAFNPCFPPYELECSEDEAQGSVTFPLAFEGPPGVVHGGALALFFDCVLQQLNCDAGQSGRTTGLSLRYRRPTPVLATLDVHATRQVVDGRLECHGELRLDGALLCEAEMKAVMADRGALPKVSSRRP